MKYLLLVLACSACHQWTDRDREVFVERCSTADTPAHCACLVSKLEGSGESYAAVQDLVASLNTGRAPDPVDLAKVTTARAECGAP